MTGIVPLPPFPLDGRNHDEQRTGPTNIPADTECSFRQRGLQEIYRKEKAEEKKAARDCTYTFSVNGNTLTLTGGEGTIGGTYELHRQEGAFTIFPPIKKDNLV